MASGGMTVQQMLAGRATGTGPVPTQTFYASNVAGTTVPRVGAAQVAAGTSQAAIGAGVNPMQLALIIVAIIGIGYLMHHLTFEESAGAREGLRVA